MGRERRAAAPEESSGVEVPEELIERELRRQEGRRRFLRLLSLLLALGSLGYVAVYGYFGYRTQRNVEDLGVLRSQVNLDFWDLLKQESDKAREQQALEYAQRLEVLPEYENLLKQNRKLVGWVKIADTMIDYPVLQTSNNEYYLDHNFRQEYDKNGSIFMDKDCDFVTPSTNIILYGHHMKSGQMFGQLSKYADQDFYQKHPHIQFDTLYSRGVYEVVYAFRSPVYREEEIVFKYYQFIQALSQREFDSNMDAMEALALYDTGKRPVWGDSLLTLSTCDYAAGSDRFVVVARRIS